MDFDQPFLLSPGEDGGIDKAVEHLRQHGDNVYAHRITKKNYDKLVSKNNLRIRKKEVAPPLSASPLWLFSMSKSTNFLLTFRIFACYAARFSSRDWLLF